MQPIEFVKMHGLGNDFVLIDVSSRRPATRRRFAHLIAADDNAAPDQWDVPAEVVATVSDRHVGIGCDQFVLVCDGDSSPPTDDSSGGAVAATSSCTVRIFNGRKGEEVGMCANALRCVALYWTSSAPGSDGRAVKCSHVNVRLPRSSQGTVSCDVELPCRLPVGCISTAPSALLGPLPNTHSRVTVDLGKAQTRTRDIPVSDDFLIPDQSEGLGVFELDVEKLRRSVATTGSGSPLAVSFVATSVHRAFAVGVGNPHCVLLLGSHQGSDAQEISGPPSDAVVDELGLAICSCVDAFPQGTNVEFVTVRRGDESNPLQISCRMRVFERGAGRTRACGSGACATGVAVALDCAPRITPVGSTQVTCIVEMDGGTLEIHTDPINFSGGFPVRMCGDAAMVCSGVWYANL